MHILHITNYYGGTPVYKDLFLILDSMGVKQTIYVPLNAKNHNRLGQQLIDFKTDGSKIIYSTVRKWYHVFCYRDKIRVILKDIQSKVDISQITKIHASTLCLDGAIALALKKKYAIDYVVGISNSDINVYYKKLFWERRYFNLILEESNKVVFVSPSYQKYAMEGFLKPKVVKSISQKQLMIPFGLNNYYFKNTSHIYRQLHTPIRLLYVGAFLRGKNLDNLIAACDKLVKQGKEITLTLIGRGMVHRNEDPKYVASIEAIEAKKEWLILKDKVPMQELIRHFRENDIFVMPSFAESFGLVYGEALTQGLPYLCTQGQGFDGFFKEGEVGFSVNPYDVDDIAHKISEIIDRYTEITGNIRNISLTKMFSWEEIGKQYLEILK